MRKAFVALALLLTSLSAQAAGLDVALSNRTAKIAVLLNPYNFRAGGGSELAIGGFLNEAGDNIAFASLMAHGVRKLPDQQYNLAAGVKLVAGDIEIGEDFEDDAGDSESVGALALGFKAGFVIPSRQNPMEISVSGFMAPNITSFSDAESFSEFDARFQVEIIPQALTYIGYRRMRFDTNDYNNIRLDRSVHLGIKLTF